MKKEIRLYRPKLFKIIAFLLLLVITATFVFRIILLVDVGVKDLFFLEKEWYESSLYEGMFFYDASRAVSFFINMAIDLFLIVLLTIGTFFNKMIIKNDRITFFYPPRLFYSIYTCNICRITPVKYKDLSIFAMISNFATDNDYLYKIEEYERTYYVACADKNEMELLAREINAKGKKTERESEGYDPKKLNSRDIITVVLMAFLVILFIHNHLVNF